MPKEKVGMGLAMYGRTFKLVDSSNTGIGAPSSGPGPAGNYTGQEGFLAYYEVRRKKTRNFICHLWVHSRSVKN